MNEKELANKKVNIELTLGEVYNLHLASLNRIYTINNLWINSIDNDSREKYEVQAKLMEVINNKLENILKMEGEE